MLGYPFGWMIAAGLIFLLLLAIALSPVVIRGRIKRVGEDDDAELRIRALFGVVHYHWQLPEMKVQGLGMELKRELTAENIGGSDSSVKKSSVNASSIVQSINWTHALLRHTDDLLGWVRRTLNHIRITEWKWTSAVGTGDAMWTAMLTGMAWSAKTTVIGVLSQLIRLQTDPEMTVQPVYQQAYFSTEGQFTAKVSFGYAIFAGIMLAVKMKHAAKGLPNGIVGWQRILLRG
ncbi:DUF2953 domain-containing protein [Paenibacillus sacheonensis]|uniref:DUF2953 domain-containing protein n=1 Tax=Paenibacillus sacheonensis TaxID=742054 RepID=A0A7X5BY11_9BACL|nr:DUF2953 domain-containing protein [Paenibacillus sacheonensis]MBM7564439.1 hypothetical protein [Paenibacillus sacheonensis]NBC69001.1 DUF2953 domain-containing protein [Paenibacillus sacheonensis]